MKQAKEEELAWFGTDEEIEAAARLQEETANDAFDGREDDMMVDTIALEEEAEINALISSMPPSTNQAIDGTRDSTYFSDDDDYDSLFMDFAVQQNPPQNSQQGSQEMACSQDMDMS